MKQVYKYLNDLKRIYLKVNEDNIVINLMLLENAIETQMKQLQNIVEIHSEDELIKDHILLVPIKIIHPIKL
jgi:hypothetical protein